MNKACVGAPVFQKSLLLLAADLCHLYAVTMYLVKRTVWSDLSHTLYHAD